MKILTNKFFILGNLLLLLVAIPVTLYFVAKQQEVRSKATASTKLYFDPTTKNTSTQCQNFTVDLMVDPGTNIVSIIDFYITYDPTKVDITQITPSTNFPTTVRASSITAGEANMSVSVGADVTRAVSSVSRVATITFTPKAAGTIQVQIDSSKSRVFSLGPSDQPTENVLSTTEPGNIAIDTSTCLESSNLTPTTSPPTGNNNLTPTPITTASPSPATGGGSNQVPICISLNASPASTGSAPFSVLFTGNGNDPDTTGLITKATFNFGDGQSQEVTTGLNLKTVTTQASHTYQNPGTYPATLIFADNTGAASVSCNRSITATSASGSGSLTPTAAPTLAPTSIPTPTTALVEKPTAAPTIPPAGGIVQTVGIISAVVLTIAIGFFLLAL